MLRVTILSILVVLSSVSSHMDPVIYITIRKALPNIIDINININDFLNLLLNVINGKIFHKHTRNLTFLYFKTICIWKL